MRDSEPEPHSGKVLPETWNLCVIVSIYCCFKLPCFRMIIYVAIDSSHLRSVVNLMLKA